MAEGGNHLGDTIARPAAAVVVAPAQQSFGADHAAATEFDLRLKIKGHFLLAHRYAEFVQQVETGTRFTRHGVGVGHVFAARLVLGAAQHNQGLLHYLGFVPVGAAEINRADRRRNALNKPGKLDGEEYLLMCDYAIMGESFLVKSDREILKAAAIIAGQHHEKWDGTGYPRGYKGEEIHIYGRIGALADVFDALGTRLCYKEPWGLDAITDFICKQRGTQFDPRLVDCLLANLFDFAAVRENFLD